MSFSRKSLFLIVQFSCLLMAAHVASAVPVRMTAKAESGHEVEQASLEVNGKRTRVWNGANGGEMIFQASRTVRVADGGAAYVEVAYVDQGYGRVNVELVSAGGERIRPDRYLGLSRMNTGKVVFARMRMPGMRSSGDGEVSVRVRLEGSRDNSTLAVESVTLQDTPFADANFQYVISDPWKGPYTGKTVKVADNTTLKGKVMVGFQGWFRTPNDPYGGGWSHWGRIQEGQFAMDMWPDVSEYPADVLVKAAEVKLKSGKPGHLFSSAWPAVVDTHFRWMRENDIDGVFLQRFVSNHFNSMGGGPEWVLANARAAANKEGRIWAIEYDVSGYPDDKLLETLKTDWKWMVDQFGLLKDPNYAREGGKPVVFIWGMPFPDRKIRVETANAVVDFFKNDPTYGGNHVIGGIPNNWREMAADWQDHIRKYECVLPWMSPSYERDVEDFGKMGLSYYAHVKPGFSWANLKHLPTGDDSLAYTPREGGRHYWNQLTGVARAKADRMFVGMFDEYDEGTAIMPMSDDAPPTPTRPGVAATFYNGANAQEHGDFALLPNLEISLGDRAPGRKIQAQNFFVRMGGRVMFPAAGQYVFTVEGAPGDDAQLYIDGKRVLSAKSMDGRAVAATPVSATAGGSAAIRLEYRHREGAGTLRVNWETADMPRQPVPDAALQDAWGRFITNEGKSADWWLKLTKSGKMMMNGKLEADSPMP